MTAWRIRRSSALSGPASSGTTTAAGPSGSATSRPRGLGLLEACAARSAALAASTALQRGILGVVPVEVADPGVEAGQLGAGDADDLFGQAARGGRGVPGTARTSAGAPSGAATGSGRRCRPDWRGRGIRTGRPDAGPVGELMAPHVTGFMGSAVREGGRSWGIFMVRFCRASLFVAVRRADRSGSLEPIGCP